MPMSETVDAEFFRTELLMGWLAFSEEFGNTPEELAKLQRARLRAGEMVFDWLQKKITIPPGNPAAPALTIPPGDPFTVAKALGDYLTKIGYAKCEVRKVSDTEILYYMGDVVMRPMVSYVRS